MKISTSYADSRAFVEADAFELLEVGCLYFPRVTGSLVLLHPWHMGSTSLANDPHDSCAY